MKTVVAMIVVTMLLAACRSQSPKQQPANAPAPPLPAGQAVSAQTSVNDDPCAIQLTNIEGALLQYYMLNHEWPAKLEDIQSFGDALDPIVLTCPTSHQPYVYNPTGLVSPTTRKRLLVYDPTPAHNGGRFCILLSPQESGKGMAMAVELLAEKEFKKFVLPLQP